VVHSRPRCASPRPRSATFRPRRWVSFPPAQPGDRRPRSVAGTARGWRQLEGLAIESLIDAAPQGTQASFFRTAAGTEIDLLLKAPGQRAPWAIEIKRSLAPKIERGFQSSRAPPIGCA
jgi:hypothetical protein